MNMKLVVCAYSEHCIEASINIMLRMFLPPLLLVSEGKELNNTFGNTWNDGLSVSDCRFRNYSQGRIW